MKIFKNLSVKLILFLALSSCASMSQNFIKEGTTQFNGGRFNDERWSDGLVFERYSWYQELTLLFDLLIAKVDESSPFAQWIGPDERYLWNQCSDPRVAIIYAQDSRRLSRQDFIYRVKKQGGDSFSIPHFRNYLRNHPEFERYSLSLYQVEAICMPPEGLSAEFPNFPKKLIR